MISITKSFIEYLRYKSNDITIEILNKAKNNLIDYLAVTTAGGLKTKKRWAEFLKHSPKGNTPLLGLSKSTDSKTACLINGYNAHVLELDDGQRFAMIHLGASIISAIEAASTENNIKLEQKLIGIIMGYEAACRIAIAMQPSHKKRGFHTAGTCGTIGAAIGVAYALSMSDHQIETVLSCAVGSSSGMLEMQEQDSQLKPYNLGRAAMDGLVAAYMGYTELSSPYDILNGERGYFRLFCENENIFKLTEYNNYFEIERTYIKQYASCRHCHSAIECAIKLRNKTNITDIKEIVIETYELAIKGHEHSTIDSPESAKLSIPYSVAAAFYFGKVDLDVYNKNVLTEPLLINLINKIRIIENTEFTKACPNKRIARITVNLFSGQSLSEQIDFAKGEPENPLTDKELINKVIALTGVVNTKIICELLNFNTNLERN